MKLIVDIPDKEYEMSKFLSERGMSSTAIKRILEGKPLPNSMSKKEITNMLQIKSKDAPKLSFIDRLKVERMHLRHKVKQLDDFLNKHDRPNDTLISHEEMEYMKMQLYHMKGYLHFIDKRLQYHDYIPKDIEQ